MQIVQQVASWWSTNQLPVTEVPQSFLQQVWEDQFVRVFAAVTVGIIGLGMIVKIVSSVPTPGVSVEPFSGRAAYLPSRAISDQLRSGYISLRE